MLHKYISPFLALAVLATFAPIVVSVVAAEEQESAAAQDAREREAALAFAKSRGLDLSKAVESETGLWSLVIEEGEGPTAKPENTVTAHCTGWRQRQVDQLC